MTPTALRDSITFEELETYAFRAESLDPHRREQIALVCTWYPEIAGEVEAIRNPDPGLVAAAREGWGRTLPSVFIIPGTQSGRRSP